MIPCRANVLKSVVDATTRHRKLAGIQPSSTEQAQQWIALGYNVISWRTDIQLYRAALQSEIAALRSAAQVAHAAFKASLQKA